MKKLILAFTLILFLGNINAQEDVIDKVADETCDCLNKRLTGDEKSSGQIEMMLGLCMIEAGGAHSEELEKETGISMDGVEAMEKLGEIVGERMAARCDKFMEILFILMGDENSMTNEAMDEMLDEMENPFANSSGIVSEISGNELLTIKIKIAGRSKTYICVGDFEGKGVVKLGNDLVGKDVYIEYEIREIYSPKLKSMVEAREIKKIELK